MIQELLQATGILATVAYLTMNVQPGNAGWLVLIVVFLMLFVLR